MSQMCVSVNPPELKRSYESEEPHSVTPLLSFIWINVLNAICFRVFVWTSSTEVYLNGICDQMHANSHRGGSVEHWLTWESCFSIPPPAVLLSPNRLALALPMRSRGTHRMLLLMSECILWFVWLEPRYRAYPAQHFAGKMASPRIWSKINH